MKVRPGHLVVVPPSILHPEPAGNRGVRLDEEDERFDRVYSQPVRDLSDINWTPARVARRVAELLDLSSSSRVLDVGSGPGKFCLVAASHSPATFVGIERRRALVEAAESAKRSLGASSVSFFHGDAFQLDWTAYNALYFYNPFGEHFFEDEERTDAETHGMDDYARAVELTQDRLDRMPLGTKVALYHGFGGGMPVGYRPLVREWCGTGILEIWLKVGEAQLPLPATETIGKV